MYPEDRGKTAAQRRWADARASWVEDDPAEVFTTLGAWMRDRTRTAVATRTADDIRSVLGFG
jgi:hypothetical protein